MFTMNHLNSKRAGLMLVVIVVLLLTTAVSFAQTAVPVEIDTNALFTSVNTWIAGFLPVFAVVIGLGIALAILTFLGARIVAVFKGSAK